MNNVVTMEVIIYMVGIGIALLAIAIFLKLLLSHKGEVQLSSTNNKVTIKWEK